MATNKLPKQMDPKDVVNARIILPVIPEEQHDEVSSGANPASSPKQKWYVSVINSNKENPQCSLVAHVLTPRSHRPRNSNMRRILNHLMGKEVTQEQ